MTNRLHGAIAASVTPLTTGGRGVDTSVIGPLVGFLAEGGVDGLLACGTTGEGVLLTVAERRAVVTEVTGSAYRTGESTFTLDPDDPLREGFLLR